MPASVRYALSVVAFLGLTLVAALFVDKLELQLWLNRINTSSLDPLFIALNMGAELPGICLALLIGVLLRFRIFFTVGLSLAMGSLLSQSLKNFAFPGFKRPYYFLKDVESLVVVPGVELHENLSMPSGHTTAAFALCFALLLYSNKRSVWIFLTLLACAMGFARVYLMQHFFVDILAGGMLGIVSALFAFLVLNIKAFRRSNVGTIVP